MAFKTHINDATNNQPGQVSTALSAVFTEGVYDLERGDFAVTGTAGLQVVVAKGEAFVENDSYVYGSQDQKFFSVASDVTVSANISSNSSGNPRIDAVCIEVDTGATPGVQGSGSSSITVVQGTAGASPAAPSIPNNYLLLALVDVADSATVISNNEITDMRKEAGLRSRNLSWDTLPYTFTYASADDPTYVMQVASTDVTDYIWENMKVRVRQSGTYKYFVVTKVEFSTNTTITLYGGTDYDLANETLEEVGVSTMRAPVGFPCNPNKWSTDIAVSVQSQGGPTANTWYNGTGNTITVPIGNFDVGYQATYGGDRGSAASFVVELTMATANNTQTDALMTSRVAGNTTYLIESTSREQTVALTTKSTRYLNIRTTATTMSFVYLEGATGKMYYRFANL